MAREIAFFDPLLRHGEERSDVAIQGPPRAALDGHAPSGLAMTDQYFGC
ncbi:hypothetical protein [Inquilinus limosus]|nr:hypothetical protein [Inquilinus limosus]